jgi:hypothetical protein
MSQVSTAIRETLSAPPRGLRRYSVTADLLVRIGRGVYEVIENPMPDDARWEHLQIDPDGVIVLTVSSAEWSPADGDIPYCAPPVIRSLAA